jgi:hypothetical protein
MSPKELANMKKAYDPASAFTTIMSNTLDKSVPYEDFEEMNQDMMCQVNLSIEEKQVTVTKTHPTIFLVRTTLLLQKRNKNQVLNLSSKLMGRKVTMTNDDIVEVMDTDGEEEEGDDVEDNKISE